jgi:hypothetical protein
MKIQQKNRYHWRDKKRALSQFPPQRFVISHVNCLEIRGRKFVQAKGFLKGHKFHRSVLKVGCSMKSASKDVFMGKGIIKKERLPV